MSVAKRIFLFFLDSFQAVLLVISFFLFLYVFVVQPHQVSGFSMFPTFHDQDLLLSNLLVTHPTSLTDKFIKELRRGDVIVFHSPTEPDKLYIKRIVGLPGETVQLSGGHVYLNGALFDETKYLKPDVMTYGEAFMRDGDTVTVPEGTFFVMGDNRPNSSDSREWGPLKETAVVGRSMIRFWPMKDFEIIHNPFTGK